MSVLDRIPIKARRFLVYLRQTLTIPDVADQSAVLDFVRADVEFRGAKAWILILAVFVASLGLNTNSTAVIIGAMLISPLMGPIIGLGTALGVADGVMFWRSFRHLATAVVLSLGASTIYFLISPFDQAASELLARTTPTLLDAAIAITGGAAGAIAMVRLDRSNVVPGVAIATALMPPLCTAGFAISQWNGEFFIGAFYLFFINSVLIAASTFAVVRLLKFDHVVQLDARRAARHRRIVWAVVIATLIPSVYTGWNMLRRQAFDTAVVRLKHQAEDRFTGTSFVVSRAVWHADSASVMMTLVGDELSAEDLQTVRTIAASLGLSSARLDLRQSNIRTMLRSQGLTEKSGPKNLFELYEALAREVHANDSLLGVALQRQGAGTSQQVDEELKILDPSITALETTATHGYVSVKRKLSNAQQERLQAWLRVRLRNDSLVVKQVYE